MPCPVIWVYGNAHCWNTKLVFNPTPVHLGTVMSCCYPALLELAWYIWVTNSRYESMVQSSDEHSTACLGNKSWRLPVIWKCIRNSLSVWMIPTKRAGLWTHMVYLNCCNHLWVLRLELNNMYGNEWKDSDLLASNQDSFWCDSIICFDVEL